MNLEWFWKQMAEVDSSIAIIIAVVSVTITAIIVFGNSSHSTTAKLERCNWQLYVINLFYHVGQSANRHGEFNIELRGHPTHQMECLYVYRAVASSQKPILLIVVEVSRYQPAEKAILVKYGGLKRHFPFDGPGSEEEALAYFSQVLRIISRT